MDRPAMRVRVAVPATSANLGPGFDVLALALDMQNEVTVEETGGPGIELRCTGAGADELGDPARNLVVRTYRQACADLGAEADGVRITSASVIPLRRGLGSSAAAALAGVLLAVGLHRPAWDEREILRRVEAVEGHGDNAAAALLGGLAVCAAGLAPVHVPVDDELRCAVLVPDVELATAAARRVVPTTVSRDDAVFTAAHTALLVRALMTRDWAALGDAMVDRLHQPARTALLPWLPAVIAAAREAGAAGAALSGAGPSVIALGWRDPEIAGAAMLSAARAEGVDGRVLVSRVRNYGARVDSGMLRETA